MRTILTVFILIAVFALFPCCEYVDELYRKGDYVERELLVDEFNNIQVDTPIMLILEQSPDHIATITGTDFKGQELTFTMENNTMVIGSSGSVYSRIDRAPKVSLPINNLVKITLNAPTQLQSKDELSQENFTLVVNGQATYSTSELKLRCTSVTVGVYGENSGVHVLTGSADQLNLTMEGLAWTDASVMIASAVKIHQRSIKSSYVHAIEHLVVNMYSSGNVYFYGQPLVEYQVFDPGWKLEFGKAIFLSE